VGFIDLIDNVLTSARVNHGAQEEAKKFAASVQPGHTYYSVCNLYCRYPGAPTQALMEFTFSGGGPWIGQELRSGHLTAAGAWLGFGPLHSVRPPRLMTFKELYERPDMFGPDPAMALESILRRVTPAGV
jgi:hypothetical protein